MKKENINSIVDSFAAALKSGGVLIQQSQEIDWIDRILRALPAKYPPSLMSLIGRYEFDEFTADKLWFFSNHGDCEPHDLVEAVFKDQFIFKTTTENGFLHFARTEDGSYDPVCFDIRARKRNAEYPVVRLDHEAILQFERIKVVDTLYTSLLDFMKAYVKR